MSNHEQGTRPLIKASGLTKFYNKASQKISVLQGLDLEVQRGEFVTIMGASGSGKSTLLHVLGCLERPTAGHYSLSDRVIQKLDDVSLSRIRANEIGYIFQKFFLLPYLTVYENVQLPLLYGSAPRNPMAERIRAVLNQVGLGHRMDHRPAELSGGETQRVAIARALIMDPMLLLADEPTGNLDEETGDEILALLRRINSGGATIVMVTHDSGIAAQADRVLQLRGGRFAS